MVAPTLSPSLPRCRGQGWSPACPLPNASSTTGAMWGPYCAAEGLHRPSSPSPSPPGGAALSPPRCPRGWGARMRGRGRRRVRALMWGQLCAQRMKCPAPRAPQPSSLCPAPRRSPPDPQPLWGAPPPGARHAAVLPAPTRGLLCLGALGEGWKKKTKQTQKKITIKPAQPAGFCLFLTSVPYLSARFIKSTFFVAVSYLKPKLQ